ncbi:hypothetical protein [Muriicola sp. Z0-33]|uniref:hypothetical protein n=1 Tax=Muriicola sp. Z0-33 TaxID=2816957 RepID=UPI0022387BB1|nr:hypothetical protein [Muriicola sp. Z0-33]MCW5516925.1 hypothetical protein [Muriicola sp. Z0-33]
MKKYVPIVLFLLLAFGLANCRQDPSEKQEEAKATHSINKSGCPPYILKNKENNLNLSVFLDLSDRITNPGIISKDTAYLSLIAKAFTDHVKTKKLVLMQDRIQVFFNPVPQTIEINAMAQKLKQEFNKDSPKSQLGLTEQRYAKIPFEIYDLAQKSGEYPGADIYNFFKDDVQNYAMSSCHRNILIILTDGYMYHKNAVIDVANQSSYLTPRSLSALPLNSVGWNSLMKEKEIGFIPVASGLEDLEVLVLGIESKNPNNPFALDIMRTYWSDWFTAMGIKKHKIIKADLPLAVGEVIKNFIEN